MSEQCVNGYRTAPYNRFQSVEQRRILAGLGSWKVSALSRTVTLVRRLWAKEDLLMVYFKAQYRQPSMRTT